MSAFTKVQVIFPKLNIIKDNIGSGELIDGVNVFLVSDILNSANIDYSSVQEEGAGNIHPSLKLMIFSDHKILV